MLTTSMDQSHLPLIIAVSGKLGVGKDYVTNEMILPYITGTVGKMAFADQVKINVASQDNSISLTECLKGNKSASLRRKLQIAGTEEGRNKYGPNVWVNTLENWIRLRQIRDGKPDVVLVTDCRFPNEADWVERNRGLLIRINAPTRHEVALQRESCGNIDTYTNISKHESETKLDNYNFEYVINNEPGSDPISHVLTILDKFLTKHLNYSDLIDLSK